MLEKILNKLVWEFKKKQIGFIKYIIFQSFMNQISESEMRPLILLECTV